ncbi:uncharacterized protein LOC113545734 [Pangasianodon hypophthalmus]|uniref:uncharacterized protein LOC113545734 n=1 Tax=Pangasianodon hypophthalmus TaxID=310915 RepID=UPI0023078634|nr:uncharacterized protein LOC113545734 [Pangasianodon hypophthalmus]
MFIGKSAIRVSHHCRRDLVSIFSHSLLSLHTNTMLLSVIFGFMEIMVLFLTPSSAVKTLEVRLGAAVTLQCDLSYHYEINWLRMNSEMKPELVMVLGLNNHGHLSVTWSTNSSNFQGFINNRFIQLRIARVSDADLVTYFCAAINEKRLEFGEGMRLRAVLDVQQPPDQNLTHCQGSDTKSEDSRGHFHTHMIISGVLNCGVLLMVFTIIAVHIMTSERSLC